MGGVLKLVHRFQRSAARLVGRLPEFSSTTAYMRDVGLLHWLIISQRRKYRITAIVSRCVLRCAHLAFVAFAALCRFWQRVGCCVLLRGVRFWSLGPI